VGRKTAILCRRRRNLTTFTNLPGDQGFVLRPSHNQLRLTVSLTIASWLSRFASVRPRPTRGILGRSIANGNQPHPRPARYAHDRSSIWYPWNGRKGVNRTHNLWQALVADPVRPFRRVLPPLRNGMSPPRRAQPTRWVQTSHTTPLYTTKMFGAWG
jgi:hypothetical protein